MRQYKTTNVNGLTCVEYNGEKVVNLCPHPINIISPLNKGEIIEIPQSGQVARVDKLSPDIERHAGFPIRREVYREIFGLPSPMEGVIYVVSAPVINVLNDSRDDVVSLGHPVRDTQGKVVATTEFRRRF